MSDKGNNRLTSNEQLRDFKAKTYAEAVEPYRVAIDMIREAIGEIFGPVASLESADAVLLRGPEPRHDAEAIIEALQRVREWGLEAQDVCDREGIGPAGSLPE